MRWTLERLKEKRKLILDIAARYGASDIRVFGSVARGDGSENSDIDLVVRFKEGTSLMDHGELMEDLTEALGCRVDIVSEGGMKDRFRANVEKEAVPL